MTHLPNSLKGTIAIAVAGLLCSSIIEARADTYIDAINHTLSVPPINKPGTTVATASVSDLQKATWYTIATDHADAGQYIHSVLLARSDRNKIAADLTAGSLSYANAFPSNPLQSGTIAGLATLPDLLVSINGSPGLSPDTVAAVAKAVILKMPTDVRSASAQSVGAFVAANYGDNVIPATTFAQSVAPALAKSGNTVVGSFCGGVSKGLTDWISFTQSLIGKVPKAAAEICYADIVISGTTRVASSGTLALITATGVSSGQKALVAKGIVAASGTASTALVINNVINSDRGTKNAILVSGVASFAGTVAGAAAEMLAGQTADMAQASAVLQLITNTIAKQQYNPNTKTPPTLVSLTESDLAKVGAAAVKSAPQYNTSGNVNTPPPNPANAATLGILQTGSISAAGIYTFAVTVAKGASTYDNAGQVGNAVANYLVTGTSLAITGSTAPETYLAVSGSLIKALPKAASQIAQRIAQLIPPNTTGTNQDARIDYAKKLANVFPNSARDIAVGVTLTDSQYAENVTKAVVLQNKTTLKNASSIAGAVAEISPAEQVCEISNVMGQLVQSGTISYKSASGITKALASATSVKKNEEELQVVTAQMVGQLMVNFVTGAVLTKDQISLNNSIVSAIADVAKQVASVAYKNNYVKGSTQANDVSGLANLVAGAASQMVLASRTLTLGEYGPIMQAITKAVKSVTNSTGDTYVESAVTTAINAFTNSLPGIYKTLCIIGVETPVTNY